MSEMMDEEIKRWTARRKSALAVEIIQDKAAAAGRQLNLTLAKIESWVEDGKRGMENALRAKPEDVEFPALCGHLIKGAMRCLKLVRTDPA